MAHLVALHPPDRNQPTFFNVDGVVGASPAQNLREDLLLVQFAFSWIASSPTPGTGAKLAAAAKAVRLTGAIDAATISAIQAMQERRKEQFPGTVVDGRVSPARGGTSYGGGRWTIISINDALKFRFRNLWPRIDAIPGCPLELRNMVLRTVIGS